MDGLRTEGLSAHVLYPVHDDFRAVTRMHVDRYGTADQIWGVAGPDAQAWVAQVEASASYRAELRHGPTRAMVEQSVI